MSERPIEEVIGWVENPPYSVADDARWVLPNGTCRLGVEVDDLAAWLVPHMGDFEIVRLVDQNQWVVSGWGSWGFGGPTIREALIAAVRKVADA